MFFRHLAVVLHGLFSIESVSHQPAMSALLYLRLIGFAAGTLVHLFLVVLVAGYRRPRAFERVLFFLALTLFLFYSGALLGLNAEIYYARARAAGLGRPDGRQYLPQSEESARLDEDGPPSAA